MTQYFEPKCNRCDAGLPLIEVGSATATVIGHREGVSIVECPRRPFRDQRRARKTARAAEDLLDYLEPLGPGFVPYDRPDGAGDRLERSVLRAALQSILTLESSRFQLPPRKA